MENNKRKHSTNHIEVKGLASPFVWKILPFGCSRIVKSKVNRMK